MKKRLTALLLLAAMASWADDAAFRFYFDLAPRSVEELDAITRSLVSEVNTDGRKAPIVVVLHGDEASVFVRSQYPQHKALVDRTALLDAYGVIDVKMCAMWMRLNGVDESDIPPFIETVPFGPAEIDRLRDRGNQPLPRVRI